MFTDIKATVPLLVQDQPGLVHAKLEVDLSYAYHDTNDISLSFRNYPFGEDLVMRIRENNLLNMYIGYTPLNHKKPIVLNENELNLAGKLTDAGMTKEFAAQWVQDTIKQRMPF